MLYLPKTQVDATYDEVILSAAPGYMESFVNFTLNPRLVNIG